MHQTKTGIFAGQFRHSRCAHPGAVKRYLRQFLSDKRVVDYISSAMVAAAAWRHTADSLPARGEALSVRVDGGRDRR